MKRILVCMLLLAWTGVALATPSSVRKLIEASMLVDGEIEVDAQGRVARYELERRELLPEGVQRFLDGSIPGWRFEPAVFEGRQVATRNRMGVLLVAKPLEDGNYQIELRSTSFRPLRQEGYEVESVHMAPPRYPVNAAKAGVGGTVYLVLRIGADGKVADVAAEQVNLRAYSSQAIMRHWRGVLADNAIDKAREWSFRPPQHGELADDGSWSVRVPVAYSLGTPGVKYGHWLAYIPGPRQRAPWAADDDGAPDALADGGVYLVGAPGGLRLLDQAGG